MVDVFSARKILAAASRAECAVSVEPQAVQITFAAPAEIVGRKEPITVHYKRVLSHKAFNRMTNSDFLELGRESRERVAHEVTLQNAGANKSKCCNAALHSSGWHHDINCPNFVTKF